MGALLLAGRRERGQDLGEPAEVRRRGAATYYRTCRVRAGYRSGRNGFSVCLAQLYSLSLLVPRVFAERLPVPLQPSTGPQSEVHALRRRGRSLWSGVRARRERPA